MEINDQNIWSDEPATPPINTETPAAAPVVEATPIVETPIAPPADIPPADIVPVTTEPPVINEIIPVTPKEIIVEKYPEMDEHQRQLFDAFQKGDEDALYNYLNEKRTNYSSMSDHDVVRAGLKKDNPDWTDKRLDLEFKNKYDIQTKRELPDEAVDPDAYDRAVAYNEAIDQRASLLEMQAEDYRIKLTNSKKDIQLPKIQEATAAAQAEPTADELAAAKTQWEGVVAAGMSEVSDLKLTVNGEEVVYKVTDEDRTGLTETMKGFNAMDFLQNERKWINKDGSYNIKNMAEDVYRFRNMDKMFSSVATRAKNEATKNVVAEIKNVDLTKNGVDVPPMKKDAGELVWGSLT